MWRNTMWSDQCEQSNYSGNTKCDENTGMVKKHDNHKQTDTGSGKSQIVKNYMYRIATYKKKNKKWYLSVKLYLVNNSGAVSN